MSRTIFDHKIWLRGPRPDSTSEGVKVRRNSGTATDFRPQLNLIEGSGITLTVTDDAVTPEVDVTIASTVTTGVAVRANSGTPTTARPQLNFIEGAGISVSVADDAGTPEADVTIAAPDALLLSRRFVFVDKSGVASANFDQFGLGTITLNGTASAVQDTTGNYVRYTNSTVGGAAGWLLAAGLTRPRYIPSGYFIVRLQFDEPPLRTWVGLSNASLQTVDNPGASVLSVAAFKYRAVDSANWRAYTADGVSAQTITDTGVTAANNTRVKLAVVLTTTNAKFYIDDVLVATHTTTLPGIDTTLAGYAASTRNAGSVLFDIARMHYVMDI